MATETHGAEESASGLPQLDISTFPNQIFWLVVALIVIYFLLAKVAMPRIESILAERHGAIQRDLDQAAELKLRAEEAEKSYQQALAEANLGMTSPAEGVKRYVASWFRLDQLYRKFIYHMQDIHPELSVYSGGRLGRGLAMRLMRWLDNQTLRRSAAIVVLSQDMADTLAERRLGPLPVYIINNFSLDPN